jgi:serine/threonine protein kinase
MAIPPGKRLGPYEILSAIGAGGMGEVYRARDSKLGRDVALKVLPNAFAANADRMARFEREARLLAALNHPHIAAIYGLEESSGTPALIMELVEGPTLADRIAAGPIPLDEALPIAKQIAEALEYAHEKGVIHRDLKPANIKVKPDGTVKVLDFGLAKALTEDSSTVDMNNSPTLSMGATVAGVILGTAAYMSPEQAKGKPADRRADIWAYGVVLYEMLTGKRLYTGETAAETLAAVLMKEPTLDGLPANAPAAIRNLLRRCLERDPRRRLQHIGEARIAIDDALSGAAPAAPVAVQGPQSPVVWIALACVLLLALAALAFVHFRETPPQPRTMRFQVPGPANSTVTFFQLSPDGQSLAFVAQKESHTQLWVQPLSSIEAQLLPGTNGATYPFWSPDSANIAYFSDGKLKKIAATGGIPQILCDAPAGRGAAWSEDGIILFAPNVSGPLYRVSAAGGVATAVTDASGTEISDRYPFVLPGGHTFLYYRIGRSSEQNGIYASSLEGLKPLHILPDDSNAVYVPGLYPGRSGYLIFRRKETLMAQPFDPQSLKLSGEMFPIAEQVGTVANTGNAAFTASANGELAYRFGNLYENRQFVWMDRTGKQVGAATKSASIAGGALSPDEKEIVLALSPDPVTVDLWLQDVSRGVLSRFTFGPDRSAVPVWSPDSRRIAYTAFTGTVFSIYQKQVNGAGAAEQLKSGGVNVFPSDWSPDEKFIVYSEFAEKTNNDIWLLPLSGDHKPVLYLQTQFNEEDGHFSPDGRWMAYMSDESGRFEIYVQPFPATGPKWQISSVGGRFPRWSHDGRELFYIAADQKLMAAPVKPGGGSTLSFEAGAPQPLFEIPSIPISFRFSYQPTMDGRRFLVDVPAGGGAGITPPITMILNWAAGGKK